MHKIVTIDISTERKRRVLPYLKERVNFPESLAQIQERLSRSGCTQIATAQKQVTDPKHGTYTKYSLAFIIQDQKFVIEFPVIFAKKTAGPVLRMDISGRIVFYKIKALLVDVELGVLDFMEAMMPFRVIMLPSGQEVLLSDYVKEYGQALAAGNADILSLPDRSLRR